MVQLDEHLTQLLLFLDSIQKKLEISCIFLAADVGDTCFSSVIPAFL